MILQIVPPRFCFCNRAALGSVTAAWPTVPLSFYPTLQFATRGQRADFEITHSSVYWPKLDCDISSDCLLRGAEEARKFAERAWRKRAKLAAA